MDMNLEQVDSARARMLAGERHWIGDCSCVRARRPGDRLGSGAVGRGRGLARPVQGGHSRSRSRAAPAGPEIGPPVRRGPVAGADGVRAGQRDSRDNLTFDEGDLQRSGAAVTLVTFQPGPDQAVLVVAARDPDAVRAWLGPQLPGRLCIVPARWTRRQLDDVRDHAKQRRQKWGVELMTERIDDNAQAQIVIAVMRVTADLSAWAATVPDGLLAVEPSLAPAT
jgi:hypothetical protein